MKVDSRHQVEISVEIPRGVSLTLTGTATSRDDVYRLIATSTASVEDAVRKLIEAGERIIEEVRQYPDFNPSERGV